MLRGKYFSCIMATKNDLIKRSLIILLIIGIVYIFEVPISQAVKSLGIINLFENLKLGLIARLITISLCIGSITLIIFQIRKKGLLPSPVSILNHLAIIGCFLILRASHQFTYEILFTRSKIYYFDVIVVFLPVFAWSFARYGSLQVEEEEIHFYEDAFNPSDKDLLGINLPIKANQTGMVTKIANIIRNTKTLHSFSIAVIGEWGSGKTTFLKSLINELKRHEENVLICFNPWKAGSKQNIYESFFDHLIKELKPYNKSAAKELKQYAQYFAGAYDKNVLFKILGDGNLLNTKDNSTDQFTEVNKLIEQTGMRFVIFIDDLDRLTGQEIIAVLKLIRSVADFGNMVFISAFDHNYVVNTVEKLNVITNVEVYLQKIFQCVLPLPPIRRSFFVDEFKKMLLPSKMSDEEQKRLFYALEKVSYAWHEPGNKHVGVFENGLTSLRDLKRLVNSFQISYSILKDEVEISELICLELVKLQSPDAFILLSREQLIKKSKTNKAVLEFNEEFFDKHFENNKKYEIIKTLLRFLFNSFGKSLRSIIYPDIFLIHIHYQLFGVISLPDWENARKMPINDFIVIIRKWIEEGKENNLDTLLKNIIPRQNYNEYTNHIIILLMLEDKKRRYYKYLEDVIYLLEKQNDFFQRNDWENLIQVLFDVSEIQNHTKAELCARVITEGLQGRHGNLFEKKEIWQKYAYLVLEKEILENKHEFNWSVREIHYRNLENFEDGSRRLILTRRSCELVRSYILQLGESYIKYLLRIDNMRNENSFIFDPWIKQVFDFPNGKDEFLKFANSIVSNDELVKKTQELLILHVDTFNHPDGYIILSDETECLRLKTLIDVRDKSS